VIAMKNFLSDKMYECLKWLTLCFLPASAVLYSLIAEVWHLPFGKEISQTINGVCTFLGVLIGVSTVQYNKTNNS